MKKIIFILIILTPSLLISQNREYEDIFLGSFWDFYTPNFLNTQSNGKGYTGIASDGDISSIIINPASVNLDNKYQVNIQYTYKTKQPWLQSIGISDLALKQQLFSGSVGFGYRINKNAQTGFIYNNPAGMYFDIGEVIRTDEFGNELGRYNAYYDISKHSFNIPFIYSYKNFSAGINLNFIYSVITIPGESVTSISHPDGYYNGEKFRGKTTYFKGDLGIIHKFNNGISLGLTLSTGGKSKVTYTYPDNIQEDNIKSTIPWKAGVGIQFQIPKTTWKFSADYRFVNNSEIDKLKNRNDFYFGIENTITKNLNLRAGFFTLFDFRNDKITWGEPVGNYDQYFITLGGSYKLKKVAVNIALLTSEFSSGTIKNTYVNGGLTFNF